MDTISALTRRANGNRVSKRGAADEKRFEIMTDGYDVVLQKVVSGLDSCKYYILSAVLRGMRYRSGYNHRIRRLSWSSEGGTRLAMPKTDLCVGYLVIEARFRGY